jgi:hypothetical protein
VFAFLEVVSQFFIVWSPEDGISGSNTLAVLTDDQLTFTISIAAIDEYVYHVLDDNYLSSNIARISDLPSLAGYATETYVGTAIGTHNSANDAHSDIRGLISVINEKIPSAASSSNQLADKAFVNSSISTNTAAFQGTYNSVSDLSLTTAATHSDIATALGSEISGADANDYCFVQIPTADATPTEIESTERYKFVTGTGWQYEYTLNNSGFTAVQWGSINSGATSTLVGQITTNANDISSLQTSVSGKVSKTGDTMTGTLTMTESMKIDFPSTGNETYFLQKNGANLCVGRTNGGGADVILARAVTTGITVRTLYITTGSATPDNQVLKRSDADARWLQIEPPTASSVTLAAGTLNTLGTVDYSTIALPATPGTAEYNGTFTDGSVAGGDITQNTGLSSVTYWSGDTTIVPGKFYSFSIQNGVGFIIQMN